jgi:hypothetical protein
MVPVLPVSFGPEGPPVRSIVASFRGERQERDGLFLTARSYWSQAEFDALWDAASRGGPSPEFVAWLALNSSKWVVLDFAPQAPLALGSQRIRVEASDIAGSIAEPHVAVAAFKRPAVRGWCLGDAHMHSTFSDSKMTPGEVKEYALSIGHHFTCFTDHLDLVQKKGWEAYSGGLAGLDDPGAGRYVAVPGIEITVVGSDGQASGDTLGYGLRTMPAIGNRQKDCGEVVSAIQASGPTASAAIAHPTGSVRWRDMMVPGTTGTEVISGGTVDEDYWRKQISMAKEVNLASARGGSDAHFSALANFSGTWVHCPGFDAEANPSARVDLVAAALRAGQTAATEMGSLAFLRFGDIYPGGEILGLVGSNLACGVYVYPINMEFDVRIAWSLFQDDVCVRNMPEARKAPGEQATWDPLNIQVQPDRHGYSLTVHLEFLQDDVVQQSEMVFCGPVYVYGVPPGDQRGSVVL